MTDVNTAEFKTRGLSLEGFQDRSKTILHGDSLRGPTRVQLVLSAWDAEGYL